MFASLADFYRRTWLNADQAAIWAAGTKSLSSGKTSHAISLPVFERQSVSSKTKVAWYLCLGCLSVALLLYRRRRKPRISLERKVILVTNATSDIGIVLIHRLLLTGAVVYACDTDLSRLPFGDQNLHLCRGDATTVAKLAQICTPWAVVAIRPSVPSCDVDLLCGDNLFRNIQANCAATVKLLGQFHSALKRNCGRFIFTDYGNDVADNTLRTAMRKLQQEDRMSMIQVIGVKLTKPSQTAEQSAGYYYDALTQGF